MERASFETERLFGIPLSVENYASFERNEEPKWEGLTNPYRHLIEGPSPLPHRIPRVKVQPTFADIGIILAVTKSDREIIGSAGFHDYPDEQGMIELGYGIVDQMQRQGFGQELLLGMWRMIIKREDVKILRYTVAPDNGPSVHIVEKYGFEKVGEQIDPEDGMELIYEQSSEEFRQRFS
jgi:RimJ/RimL family protein N-acetyltransferase